MHRFSILAITRSCISRSIFPSICNLLIKLSRRPAQRSSSEQMQMEMEYRLTRSGADVEDRSIAVFDAAFAGDFGGHQLAAAKDFSVGVFRFFESRDVLSGNDQHVGRCLRRDVVEGEDVLVFPDLLCGNPAGENLAEKTVSHGEDFKFKI